MSAMELIPLGDIADLQAGVGFPLDMQGRDSGDYPLAKVGDISRVARSGETTIFAADHFVDEADLPRLNAKPIPAGSILFSKIGEAIRQNYRVIAGCPLLIDNNAMAAIPNARVESRFLYHFLRTVDFYSLASATTVPALRKSVLERLPVPLPPLAEQRRIADILDKADALRAKRRAALAQLDTLTQSIFLDMFGDPATNPKGWPAMRLGELIVTGPQNGLYKPAGDYGSGTPILRIDSFYDGEVTDLATLKRVRVSNEEIELYRLRPNEIVINRVNSREYLGKSALIPELSEPIIFESNMMRLGVDTGRLHPVYLIQLLQSRHVRAHILGSAKDAVNQSSINQQDVKSIPVVLPPRSQQELFARRLQFLRSLTSVHHSSLAKLNMLFSSLQHVAFAGEL